MSKKIEFSFIDEEGDSIVESLPAQWEICQYCEGEGAHCRHLGAITEEDRRNEWSEEEFQAMLDGALDRECEVCKGKGKVLELNIDALNADMKALVLAQIKRNERDQRERESEIRWGF